MESLITDINWLAVVVGAVVAYILGAVWYSDKFFAQKWKAGIGTPAVADTPMMYGMVSQAFGTFFLAWVIGVTQRTDSVALAVLVALTIATLIKANGFFAGKTKYAISVEVGFVLVMVLVMLLAHKVL